MLLTQLIKKAKSDPKKLFVIDGIGALISAFLLGIVFVNISSYIGIPTSTLYILAAFPIFFAIFDMYCYQKEHNTMGILLKTIAVLNLLYCFISIGFAIYHKEMLTNLGWIYISVEILILVFLSFIEFTVGKKIMNHHHQDL